jgi:hypothetical protein
MKTGKNCNGQIKAEHSLIIAMPKFAQLRGYDGVTRVFNPLLMNTKTGKNSSFFLPKPFWF